MNYKIHNIHNIKIINRKRRACSASDIIQSTIEPSTISFRTETYNKTANLSIQNNKKMLNGEKEDVHILNKFNNGKKFAIIALQFIFFITYISIPTEIFEKDHKNDKADVWFYAWLTAVSTSFGVIPFLVFKKIDTFWLGISNGIAAGMMLAASVCLIYEGTICLDDYDTNISCGIRTFFGLFLGVWFILFTKKVLEKYENLKLLNLDAIDSKKILLIMGVMTLHSFSEGVGIGVSFAGKRGNNRGILISTTLAIHNVPEGLAVSLVLVPRGISVIHAALWSIISSLPQPIMAVIAHHFIEEFLPTLPIGLGFAAGAMGYIGIFELLLESLDEIKSKLLTFTVISISFIFMCISHILLHN